MKKKLQHLLCLHLLFFISIAGYALPKIDNVIVTNSKCASDGQIEVVVSNITGVAKYTLEYIKSDGTITAWNPTPQTSNKFTGLPSGNYIVHVYDSSMPANTSVSQRGIKIESSYVFMGYRYNPIVGSDYYEHCLESGTLTISINGGISPRVCKITNLNTNETFTQTFDTPNEATCVFKNLPSGKYDILIKDPCQSLAKPNGLTIEVKSSGASFKNLNIQNFSLANVGMLYYIDKSDCSVLNHKFTISQMKINGDSKYVSDYGKRQNFQFIIEYPAGSGNYTDPSPQDQDFAVTKIKNFNSSLSRDYKIAVIHPCSGDTIWDSRTYTIPQTNITFVADRAGFIYDGLCQVESQSFRITQALYGLDDACSIKAPYTVTTTNSQTGVVLGQENWLDPTQPFYSSVKIQPNTTFLIIVKDSGGKEMYRTTHVSYASNTPAATMNLTANKWYNNDKCDFETFTLYGPIVFLNETKSVHKNLANSKIKVEILSGPVSKAPLIMNLPDPDNPGDYYPLWDDLPLGTYKFKYSFYASGVDPAQSGATPCFSEEKELVATKNRYSFESDAPIVTSPVCKSYTVTVKGGYVDGLGDRIVSKELEDSYKVLIYPSAQGIGSSNTRLVQGYNYGGAASYPYATINNLAAGKYTIKIVHPSVSMSDLNNIQCYLGGGYEIDITNPDLPLIDPIFSGGIACDDGYANLTVSMKNGAASLYKYRMKKFTDSDANYTAWQSSNVFPNIVPGKYRVGAIDACGNETNTEITVFDGEDQFLVIQGEVPGNVGHICEEKTTVLSVLSIGLIRSYSWYKDGVLIPGATGPTYSIVNATSKDAGVYKVEVDNGSCILESSVHIIGVDAIPNAPILEASGCGTATTTLTITNHKSGQIYTWYHDGVVIGGVTGTTYTTNKQGAYAAMVNEVSGKCSSHLSNVVTISYPVLYWKTDAASYDWNDADNWIAPDGSSVTVPPGTCTEVHIGYSAKYPNLATSTTITNLYGTPSCDRIIFHYGSELNTPENLDYNQAIVQYNLGYYNGNYSGSLSDYEDNYPSQAMTGKPLIDRGSWQLISSPLKKMVSGDFSLAGYPMTWQSNISVTGSYTGTNLTLTEVNFTSPFNTNDIELSNNNHALALKVAGYKSGVLGQSNHKYLENLKGIIAYPYFEDATIMSNRPGTNYNRIRQESTLYYFNVNTLETIYNPVGRIKRGAESYRFVFESDATNQVDTIRASGPSNGVAGYTMKLSRNGSDYVLMGNPFMNRMFFFELLTYNNDRIDLAGFYRFDPTTKTWIFNNSHGVIYPLESYLIKLKPGVTDLLFPISLTHNGFSNKGRSSSISTSNMIVELLSSEEELRSSAELTSDTDQSNVEKLVNVEGGSSPEVYFIDEGRSYNLIQSYDGSSRVALGVRSSDSKSPMTLRFEQLSELASGHNPVLVDKLFDVRVDLSQQSDYTFYQRDLSSSAQYADNNRFELRFVDDVSSLVSSDITIRYQSGELFVISKDVLSTIVVYDLQGRQLSSFDHVGTSAFRHDLNLPQGIYIVKATTVTSTSKSEKAAIM